MFKSQRTIFSPQIFYCLFFTYQLIIAEDAENKVKNMSLSTSNEIATRSLHSPVARSQNVQDLDGIQFRSNNPTKKKYWVGQELVSWLTALSNCSRKKMRLASIRSAEDQLEIVREINRIQGSDEWWSLWVGGTDLFEEGSWMWMDDQCGSRKFGYTIWKKDEPAAKKSCIQVMYDGWMTSPCDDKHHYVCEYY